MKKIKNYPCLVCVLGLFHLASAQAQLQLTSSNAVPKVGDVFTLQDVDSLALVNFTAPQPGVNQQWDFSSWTSSSAPYQIQFVSPAATPYDTSFTNASLAAVDLSDTSYTYYQVQANRWQKSGIGSAFFGAAPYVRAQLQMEFPLGLGASLQIDSFKYDLFVALFGFNLSAKGIDSLAVIGSGSLKLPGGVNYSNVLCVLRITHEADELGAFGTTNSSSVQYEFYDGVLRYPVLVVTNSATDGFGANGLSASILKSAGTLSATSTALSADQIRFYPNPTSDFLQLPALKYQTLQVFDANGLLKFTTDQSVRQIAVNQYPAGRYFLLADGKYRGSFMVVH